MPPEDRVRVLHMIEAAETAIRAMRDKSLDDLRSDDVLSLAMVKALEIVGEAAWKVTPGTQAAIPQLPWDLIARMRHRLVHAYFDINLETVWRTIHEKLPPMLETLREALRSS
ncbi:MAG TPA: DUF86 domain-containing protein [Tepidisphaeraceae bacterium]|nr:DUF86 domain-containing protein [Tepidisphaeraceae bacterium]